MLWSRATVGGTTIAESLMVIFHGPRYAGPGIRSSCSFRTPSVNVARTYFSLSQPYSALFSGLLGYLSLHNVGPQIMQFRGVEMAGDLRE